MNGKKLIVSLLLKVGLTGLMVTVVGIHYFGLRYTLQDVGMHVDAAQDVYDSSGYTELMEAAIKGDVPALKSLIAKGVNLDAQAVDTSAHSNLHTGNTALTFAIMNANFDANVEAAKVLIAAGANVRLANGFDAKEHYGTISNGGNGYGQGPIHMTSQITNLDVRADIMGRLIKKGADINAQDNDGQTLAHLVVAAGDRQAVEQLRHKFGSIVDFCIKNKTGQNPLDLACELGRQDVPNGFSNSGYVSCYTKPSCKDFQPTIITDPFARDTVMGMTGIMLAALVQDKARINRLLELGADINAVIEDDERNTALHLMLLHQNVEMLQYLLDRKADANKQNAHGDRPLHYVLKIDGVGKATVEEAGILRSAATKSLIEKGADINALNNAGQSVLDLAVAKNEIGYVKFLVATYGNKISKVSAQRALSKAKDLELKYIVPILNEFVQKK
jgi:ankyrin repeat protein